MDSHTYDYIIVGAGSAGAVLANRLSADRRFTVLCLEAGVEGADYFWSRVPVGIAKLVDNPAVNWCYRSEPDEGTGQRSIEVPRGKMLGGSSSINGMVFVRGQAADYDHWAQLGNRGWSYADVLPLFRRMESYDGGANEFRGDEGPLKVTTTKNKDPLAERMFAAAERIGLSENPDYNGDVQEGISMSQVTISKGRRQSTAFCYLDPAQKEHANLTVAKGAMAESLILDGKTCVGVRYRQDGGVVEARAQRETIVCGGSINSPKLLELSGIGDPEILDQAGVSLAHTLPGVGENLRDHYSPRVKFSISKKNLTYNDKGRGWRLAQEALKYAMFRTGFLANTSVPVRMYFRTREGLDTPDATISVMPFLYEMVGRERKIAKRSGITMNINVLRSDSLGSIHIKSTDPAEPPAIRFNFLSSPLDREGLLVAMRKARDLMSAGPMAEIVGEEIAPGAALQSDEELLEWVRNNAETTYHPVGTCKMGNDANAVVDDHLRVHGIAKLRVADASIMPTLTSGNTNAPSIMIGEKCSDMILAAAAGQ